MGSGIKICNSVATPAHATNTKADTGRYSPKRASLLEYFYARTIAAKSYCRQVHPGADMLM